MTITSTFDIICKPNGEVIIVNHGISKKLKNEEQKKNARKICREVQKLSDEERLEWVTKQIKRKKYTDILEGINDNPADAKANKNKAKEALNKLILFFKDINFEPNYRFVNTLALKLLISKEEAFNYVDNYFALADSPYRSDISAKIHCQEFEQILDEIGLVSPTVEINKRFKIYYGSQGTGKTTSAMDETEGRCIICNNNMNCDDLMKNFDFKDNGNATFRHSLLRQCMEEGKPITFDEINLLPYDSLRFLQGLLDSKREFNYGDDTIYIKEGFMVIGTMNLSVNGMVYCLPEPLVDRCADIKKFELNADLLINAYD